MLNALFDVFSFLYFRKNNLDPKLFRAISPQLMTRDEAKLSPLSDVPFSSRRASRFGNGSDGNRSSAEGGAARSPLFVVATRSIPRPWDKPLHQNIVDRFLVVVPFQCIVGCTFDFVVMFVWLQYMWLISLFWTLSSCW